MKDDAAPKEGPEAEGAEDEAAAPSEESKSVNAPEATSPESTAPASDASEVAAGEAAAPEAAKTEIEFRLPKGNKPHFLRGGLLLGAGLVFGLFFLMLPWSPAFGVPLTLIATLVAIIGAFDILGTFDDANPLRLEGSLARPFGIVAATGVVFWLAMRAAVGGLPLSFSEMATNVVVGVAVTATFLALLAAIVRLFTRLGVLEADRPLHRRHGFILSGATTLLYLPTLGSHTLIDPWETHYGEVSREILARSDWISLWWAHEDWFWSKPILVFWLQSLSMVVFGVRFEPGRMLSAIEEGRLPHPEWAMRFPIFLMALVAGYLLYKAVARARGRRAGLLAGLVLTTMPQWFFIGRQTMTDLPFVAAMVGAIAFYYLGYVEDPERRVRSVAVPIGRRRVSLSAYHAVFGAILLVAIPQILYLVTRNVVINYNPVYGLLTPPITTISDSFMAGSAGNCGLPGNQDCAQVFPAHLRLQPAAQGLLWMQALALLLYINWGERRRKHLLYIAAWTCAAIATMGKGPAGLVLPAAAVFVHLIIEKRTREILELELASGALAFLAVAMPWFVAMVARHGTPFVERLIVHDVYKRAMRHVHDTNRGDDVSFRYYLWQLGYATFPWIGLVPSALLAARRPSAPTDPTHSLRVLAIAWILVGFTLFSYMETKFHHYVFPIVPALAILVGLHLDDLLTANEKRSSRARFGIVAFFGVLMVLVVGRDMFALREGEPSGARLIHLFTYLYERAWPEALDFSWPLLVTTLAAAVAFVMIGMERLRRAGIVALTVVAVGFSAFVLDLYFMRVAPHWGQRNIAVAYYRERLVKDGPIVSYQQNWKGENFYTGNAIPAFPSTGRPFRDWIAKERKKKTKVFYFFVIPNRMDSLASEVDGAREVVALTSPDDNNKFVLARVTFD